jgi:hypothetical protein
LNSNPIEHTIKFVGSFIQNILEYENKKLRKRYRIERYQRPKKPKIHQIEKIGTKKRKNHQKQERGELMVI